VPRETLVYRGWIGGRESDRAELQELGVSVGNWNSEATAFDYCSMTSDVFVRFCRTWKGRFVWGLIGKRETVYSKQELAKQAADDDVDVPF
jgi:hypothetical protein